MIYGYRQPGFAVLDNRRILTSRGFNQIRGTHIHYLYGKYKDVKMPYEPQIDVTPSMITVDGRKFDRKPLFDAEGTLFGIESGV